MASSTRGQIAARHARIKKSTTVVRPATQLGQQLRDIALFVLEIYPLSDGTDSSAHVLPDPEDVKETMSNLMPAPDAILTEELIKSPLFPIATLHDIARLFEFGGVRDNLLDSLEITEIDRENKSVMTHIWFLDFLGCDTDTIQAALAIYRRTRGSPNSLQRAQANEDFLETMLNNNPANLTAAEMVTDRQSPTSQGELHNERTEVPGRPNNRTTPSAQGARSIVGQPQSGTPTIPNPPRSGVTGSIPTLPTTSSDRDDTRKANYVLQHFKDNRFTGALTQTIEMTLRDYNICARQHRLTQSQKADYFVNILDGPARTFFFNNSSESMPFEEMAEMMIGEFNSNSRQLQVYGRLTTLRIERVITENELNSFSEALTKIVTIIEMMTPQCPPHFRSEPHKITYLRNAVIGQQWSRTPISNIVTSHYTFNGFVTALRESMQLEEEIKSARSDGLSTRPSGTFFQQYGRNPRYVRTLKQVRGDKNIQNRTFSFTDKDSSSRSFAESRRRNECHKCRARWTPGHRCQSGAIRNHVRHRMRNGESAVHIVSDLVLGMEGEFEEDPSQEGTSSAQDSVDNALSSPHVHFSTEPDEVQLFDSLTGSGEDTSSADVEQTKKEWMTHHLQSSLSSQPVLHNNETSSDF